MRLASLVMRWRWRLFAGVFGVTLAACVSLFVWPIATGRTDAPYYGKALARQALANARKARADRWATGPMIAAEAATRAALVEYRVQEVKLLPFRDFRVARAALDDATAKCQKALAEANRARLGARSLADEAIGVASQETARSASVADSVHIGTRGRALLQKSKMALYEAREMYDRGDYNEARSRARDAINHARVVSHSAVEQASRFTNATLLRQWRRMISETEAWSRTTGRPAIVVLKENHRLELYDNGRIVRIYRADMGYRSFGAKERSGDAATPEGRYKILKKKTRSTYYKALELDYPNAEDRIRFEERQRRGEISRRAHLGGLIEIHGDGGRGKDWTKGCIALTNGDIDDLFRRVPVGTPVTIVGGNGTGVYTALAREGRSARARTE